MALTLGTNSGFVSSRPSGEPAATMFAFTDDTIVTKDTSPSGVTSITEIGYYCASGYGTGFEYRLGLYEDDAGAPGDLLFSTTATSATAVQWSYESVSWSISASTAYWLALFGGGGAHYTDKASSGGSGYDIRYSSELPDPFNGSALADSDGMAAVYALTSGGGASNVEKINIGDAWKTIDGFQINIGDAWKTVSGMQVNIGDAWKTIF